MPKKSGDSPLSIVQANNPPERETETKEGKERESELNKTIMLYLTISLTITVIMNFTIFFSQFLSERILNPTSEFSPSTLLSNVISFSVLLVALIAIIYLPRLAKKNFRITPVIMAIGGFIIGMGISAIISALNYAPKLQNVESPIALFLWILPIELYFSILVFKKSRDASTFPLLDITLFYITLCLTLFLINLPLIDLIASISENWILLLCLGIFQLSLALAAFFAQHSLTPEIIRPGQDVYIQNQKTHITLLQE